MKSKSPNEEEYCLNCICNSILKVASYIGINYAIGSCVHGKKSSFVEYQHSKIAITSCVFFEICVSILAVYNITQLIYDEEMRNKVNFIFKLGLVSFQINIFIICLTQLIHHNEIVRERQGFSAIINNKSKYGTDIMIDKRHGSYFHRCSLFYIAWSVFITCVITIMEFMYMKHYAFWALCNVVAACIYMLIETLFCFIIVFKAKLYHHLLRGCHNQIKTVLNKRLELIEEDEKYSKLYYVSEPKSRMSFSVTNIIQKKIRLHCAVIKNLEYYNNTLNPNILFHIILHTFILTLNVYLIVSLWIEGITTHIYLLILKEVETFCMIMGALWVLHDVELLFDEVFSLTICCLKR